MVAWYWLLVALAAGAAIGTLIAALCVVAKQENEE